MRAPQIGYMNIFVSDLERAVECHRDALGLPLQLEEMTFGYASTAPEGIRLGLAAVDPCAPDSSHLVGRHTGVRFGVPDLDAGYRRHSARGVRFTMVPTKHPWGGYRATSADPDANLFYLDQLHEE